LVAGGAHRVHYRRRRDRTVVRAVLFGDEVQQLCCFYHSSRGGAARRVHRPVCARPAPNVFGRTALGRGDVRSRSVPGRAFSSSCRSFRYSRRLLDEENFLRKNLAGYPEYMQRVRAGKRGTSHHNTCRRIVEVVQASNRLRCSYSLQRRKASPLCHQRSFNLSTHRASG
jgi:hypothetical protein